MNHKNGKPQDSAIQDCFCCAPCTMPVPIQPGTQTRGGVYQDSVMRCTSTIVPIYLPQRGLSVIARPARSDPAEKGRTGATPPFLPLYRQTGRGGCTSRCTTAYPPFQGSLPSDLSLREGSEHVPQAGADAPEASPMKMRYPILISGGLCCSVWGFIYRPFPLPGNDPVLDLVLYHTPNFYGWIVRWYYAAPAVALIVGGLVLISVWRVWFETWGSNLTALKLLPPWPLSADKDAGPGIVVGEVHHPVKPVEISKPSWLIIPERGLYTGVAIFGAVGSGKTSACMHPFAEQILSWQAGNPQRRAAGLILEVKGDFCHDIRRILADAGREEDYIELGMEGSFQWNPLSTKWLDSYSLAYTISSLLNQLFGKGKEPFWQQAYTNLVRWIIELYRVFPGQWVTLRQVYHCAIDKELFAAKIKQAEAFVRELQHGTVVISFDDYLANADHISGWKWQPPTQENTCQADHSPSLESQLKELQIEYRIEWTESVRSSEIRQRVEAVNRWYQHDWRMIDNKIRSSIVEGISVFLSIFDLPDVARVFCPPPPPKKAAPAQSGNGEPQKDEQPGLGTRVRQSLPPLDELIESGKVLALNMPAGSNPALARAVGVMLKNAWLQSLLRRPSQMKAVPDQYFRPAVFICDEYQSFASVGEDDPSGDEKSFALTRQCRCIPIVATQSISSLRSVLGSMAHPAANLAHPDIPFLERRRQCANRLGAMRPGRQDQTLLHHHRICQAKRGVNALRASRRRPGQRRGQKIFPQATRGGVPAPRVCPALQLPGHLSALRRRTVALPDPRVPQAPLPSPHASLLAGEGRGETMSDGLELLKPFLPGLEGVLEDPEVSEIMINGPHNVWIEEHGKLYSHEAPLLTASALNRAAIHIARPLGLDPATAPIVDARLEDGSRVAICVPPASPKVAITVRRFGKRAFSAADLVEQGALP